MVTKVSTRLVNSFSAAEKVLMFKVFRGSESFVVAFASGGNKKVIVFEVSRKRLYTQPLAETLKMIFDCFKHDGAVDGVDESIVIEEGSFMVDKMLSKILINMLSESGSELNTALSQLQIPDTTTRLLQSLTGGLRSTIFMSVITRSPANSIKADNTDGKPDDGANNSANADDDDPRDVIHGTWILNNAGQWVSIELRDKQNLILGIQKGHEMFDFITDEVYNVLSGTEKQGDKRESSSS